VLQRVSDRELKNVNEDMWTHHLLYLSRLPLVLLLMKLASFLPPRLPPPLPPSSCTFWTPTKLLLPISPKMRL
jgi:hypothetical protein